MLLKAYLIAAMAVLVQVVRCDDLDSAKDMLSIFQMEKDMVSVMKTLVNQTEQKTQSIQNYLEQYQSLIDENIQNGGDFEERILGNPIHIYQLMRRLTVEWKDVEEALKQDNLTKVLYRIKAVTYEREFPEQSDMHEAAKALIRLQDIYELDIFELARGNIWGVPGRAKLTVQDCLFMGKHCLTEKKFSRAVEWFEVTVVLAGLENNHTVRQDQASQYLEVAIKLHDQARELGAILDVFPQPLSKVPLSEQRKWLKKNKKYQLGRTSHFTKDLINFNALCRGEQLLDEKYVSELKCWLGRPSPYFYLMPVKIEQHHLQPAIYTFHDVITETEIAVVKKLSLPKLTRATVQGRTAQDSVISNVRTSRVTWLSDSLHPLLPKLSHRISLLTGLSTNTVNGHAEMLQVGRYGIGGYYGPHHDYLIKDKPSELVESMPDYELQMGDRIGTFMFYLNDVIRGGATAFPQVGVATKPVKGAAAFWWNLKKSGEADPLTLHGGCPVVYGSKWVSNKWIRETAQTFRRPCSLDIND